MTTASEPERIAQALLAAHRIWIISHIAPDADTMGSALALYWSLSPLGIRVRLSCADPVPLELRFLPGASLFTTDPYAGEELIVAVDISDVQRWGSLYNPSGLISVPVLNIDHHVTNTRFGSLNWVQENPATCEIIMELVQALHLPISPEAATCLLAGIVGDTQCFRTSNTAPTSLQSAAALQALGAPLFEIANQVLNRRPASALAVWKEALLRVKQEPGIVTTSLGYELLHAAGADDSSTNGLSSWLAGIEGVKIAAVLREMSVGRIDISMRSTPGIDVARVAKALGGGGHPQAAGCVITGTLAAANSRLWELLRPLLQDSALHPPAVG